MPIDNRRCAAQSGLRSLGCALKSLYEMCLPDCSALLRPYKLLLLKTTVKHIHSAAVQQGTIQSDPVNE